MLQLPSSIRRGGPNYIRMPQTEKVVESDEEWAKCGKWLLLNPEGNNLAWTDKVWTDLQVLLQKGVLIMLKAPTAANMCKQGCVLCYTGHGKETAKKAAEEIRRIIHHEYAIFYKTNEMTDSNIHQRSGHKFITKYLHTFKGLFYVRDTLMRWKLDGCNREELIQLHKWNPCDFELEKLPSRSDEEELNHQLETCRPGYWHAKCSLEEDENGLTETDRVWLVVKKMFDGGRFTRIRCFKNPGIADIHCYVADYSDINFLMKICDDIRKFSGYSCFMYFRITVGTKERERKETESKEIYMYTAEKELYEMYDYAKKFLLQKH